MGYKANPPLPDGRIRNPNPDQLKVGQTIGYAIRDKGSWTGEFKATVIEHNGRLAVPNPIYLNSLNISIGTIYPTEEDPVVETPPAVTDLTLAEFLLSVTNLDGRPIIGPMHSGLNAEHIEKRIRSYFHAFPIEAPVAAKPLTLEEFLYVRDHVASVLGNTSRSEPIKATDYITAEHLIKAGTINTKKILESRR